MTLRLASEIVNRARSFEYKGEGACQSPLSVPMIGRQLRPKAVAAGDHQKIVLIDRRGLERDHHFVCRWGPDVGDVDRLDDLDGIAECVDLDCSYGCSPPLGTSYTCANPPSTNNSVPAM